MPDPKDSSIRRASQRGTWPVHKYRLGDEPSDDLRGSTTAEQRLAMVWQLTLDAWALTGLPLPAYDRGEAPVRKSSRKLS